jgi:hypothetical protein
MAKAAARRKEEDADINVAITGHAEIRRAILSAAKDAISVLQMHQRMEELRRKKEGLFVELRATLREIIQLNMRLDRILPKVKASRAPLKEKILRSKPMLIVEERKAMAERPKPIARGRLDELEEELADIESRMNSIR